MCQKLLKLAHLWSVTGPSPQDQKSITGSKLQTRLFSSYPTPRLFFGGVMRVEARPFLPVCLSVGLFARLCMSTTLDADDFLLDDWSIEEEGFCLV